MQDRLDLDAELLDRLKQPLGLIAGIDEQRPLGAGASVADDVGVLLNGTDREGADIQAVVHRAAALGPPSLAFLRMRRLNIQVSV